MPHCYVITGHYGVGKTNFSVNLALYLKSIHPDKRITVCDIDIVNPYFRTADFGTLFTDNGIFLAAPRFANSNLDIPAINFDMAALLDDCDFLIIDSGGDDAGAAVLGGYTEILGGCEQLDVLYAINCYRCLTENPEQAVEIMREIESVSRLRHTAIVNCSNLGDETTELVVENSVDYAETVCKLSNLPLLGTVVRKPLKPNIKKILPCEIYVKNRLE